MDAVREFLYLGGYGVYVWPAFAVAALALGWMAVSTLRRLRENERMLERLQRHRSAPADVGGKVAREGEAQGKGR